MLPTIQCGEPSTRQMHAILWCTRLKWHWQFWCGRHGVPCQLECNCSVPRGKFGRVLPRPRGYPYTCTWPMGRRKATTNPSWLKRCYVHYVTRLMWLCKFLEIKNCASEKSALQDTVNTKICYIYTATSTEKNWFQLKWQQKTFEIFFISSICKICLLFIFNVFLKVFYANSFVITNHEQTNKLVLLVSLSLFNNLFLSFSRSLHHLFSHQLLKNEVSNSSYEKSSLLHFTHHFFFTSFIILQQRLCLQLKSSSF